MSPHRVPMTSPASGVSPIDVSMDRPFSMAAIEAPLPRWHVITRELALSISAISYKRRLT